MSHHVNCFGAVSRLCLFLCPSLASIQISFVMDFWLLGWYFFVVRVTVDQIKYGLNSPEVQVASARETNGALLGLCFELVPQMCNSRNPVKRPQLGHCSHSWNCDAGTCLCGAMLCHAGAPAGTGRAGVSVQHCAGAHCSSVAASPPLSFCRAWGWKTQG